MEIGRGNTPGDLQVIEGIVVGSLLSYTGSRQHRITTLKITTLTKLTLQKVSAIAARCILARSKRLHKG